MQQAKCKICRRLGKKMFLKGSKCYSPKCAMIRRPYAPGQPAKSGMRRNITDYAREFAEKQRIKAWYGLREKQFKNYVKDILDKISTSKIKADEQLIKKLESRMDNVVFRLGFAESHAQARHLVSYGHFLLNGRKTDIPSAQIKIGDKIEVKLKSKQSVYFTKLEEPIKKHVTLSWLKLNPADLSGEVIGVPNVEETALPIKLSSIFEHYSK